MKIELSWCEKRQREALERDILIKEWGSLKKTRVTEDMKNDFRMVQLRNYADPKRFYRKNDMSEIPSNFQVGTVIQGKYEPRHRGKEHKRLADEVLSDKKAVEYTQRTFKEKKTFKKKPNRTYV